MYVCVYTHIYIYIYLHIKEPKQRLCSEQIRAPPAGRRSRPVIHSTSNNNNNSKINSKANSNSKTGRMPPEVHIL